VTVCLSLFIPINYLTTLACIAIAGGLCFLFFGFRLRARERLLLSARRSRIHSAALGLIEVNGKAVGPHTMPALITGKPCFLYHTTAWQQRDGNPEEWEKIADETLHLPFFIEDSTGQLLVEPLGADLDLLRDFREEYASSSLISNSADLPPRVNEFLIRHSIVATRRIRIEENLIKPEDPLFVAGTLMENPGVQLRALAPIGDARANVRSDASYSGQRNDSRTAPPAHFSESSSGPKIIRLAPGTTASSSQYMGQQAKIVAALTRAGITKPEAWSVAGVPLPNGVVEENATLHQVSVHEGHSSREQSASYPLGFAPPLVLVKGANNPMFVISFRSQKEFVTALARKSAAMLWGGAAITLLGLYVLLRR
jgi:hypothetical protein